MEEIKIIDAKMPEEVGIKGDSNEKSNQTNQVLDNILCDD